MTESQIQRYRRNEEIRAKLKSGASKDEIEKEYSLDRGQVNNILAGRSGTGLTEKQVERQIRNAEIVELVRSGLTFAAVAERYGMSYVMISNIAAEAGLYRPRGGNNRRRPDYGSVRWSPEGNSLDPGSMDFSR